MSKELSAVGENEPEFKITLYQQALASCTGAVITSLFVTPLDVVKIRLQVQQRNMGKCFLYCNGLMDHLCDCTNDVTSKEWYRRPGHFNGTIDAFLKISKNEGVASLWSGLSPTLVLAIPATVVYFVTYEQLRTRLKEIYNQKNSINETIKQPLWIPLLAGSSARIISASTVSPLELIRTKMQSQKLTYLEIGGALKSLIEQDGFRGLWKGVLPTLLRDVPFSAIYWVNYELIKSFYTSEVPSFWYSFMAGAVSGSIAATFTTPFDVVKTHQQIEFGEETLGNTNRSSTLSLFKRIYFQQGLRGLFAGLAPRIVKVAPACAIMIATFEHGKVFFNRLASAKFYNNNLSSDTSDLSVSKTSLSTHNSSLSLQSNDPLVRNLKM